MNFNRRGDLNSPLFFPPESLSLSPSCIALLFRETNTTDVVQPCSSALWMRYNYLFIFHNT